MPNNANRRRGIAGIPGRNLNSVRGSLDISGLYPVRRAHGSPHYGEGAEAQIQDYIDFQAGTRPSITPTLEELQAQEGIFKTYLGDSGYEQERETSQKNAKLQAALALAQAGFGLMGAQPGEGESPMSVMGRAFGAPLAERMGAISGTFAERDAARRAAQRAEERQIKLQAFQDVTSRKQAEATRYTEDRESAYAAIQSGTSFLENQQTKIDGVWTDVGQIRRVMTGPFKNIPEYYNATTGAKITTPIRDFIAPEKAPKDSVTKLDDTLRWIPAGTADDPNAGNWVKVPAYTRVTYNRDGSVSGSSLHFFNDNSEARFEDRREKRQDGTEVTLTANAKFAPDAESRKQGRLGHVRELEDGKPKGPVVPINYTFIDGKYTVLGLGDDADPVILAGPNATHVLVDEKTGEVPGPDVGKETSGLEAGDYHLYNSDGSVYTIEKDGKTRTPIYSVLDKGENRGKLVEKGSGKIFDNFAAKGFTVKKIYQPSDVSATQEESDRQYRGALASLNQYVERGDIVTPREDAFNYNAREGFTVQGTPLNTAAQDKVRSYFRDLWDNTMSAIKVPMGATEEKDLTRKFADKFFNTRVTDILTEKEIIGVGDSAIEMVAPTEVVSVVNPERVYRPRTRDRKIALENYHTLEQDFADNAASENPRTAWEVMGSGDSMVPMPYHATLASNPIGRVGLMVNFMPHVWSNPQTHSDATTWKTNQGGREAIHNRMLFEQVAKDPGVISKSANLNDRDAALRQEVAKRKEEAANKINGDVSVQLRTDVPTTLAMLELTSALENTLLRIDPTGFVKGGAGSWLARKGLLDVPLENAMEMIFSGKVEGLDEQEVGDLYREFLSKANVLNELGGRALLKASGDTRYSDKDMEGAKRILLKLGESGEMNLANLQELRGYLLNSLDANLTGVGTIGLTDETIIRAIKAGGSLEGVRPSRNGVWSPFVREKYAVTGNKMPGYDRNTVEQWNTQAALEGALKDGVYFLPREEGNTPWGEGQATPIPQGDLFEIGEGGRYKHQKLIDNYKWWRRELRGTQFGSQ